MTFVETLRELGLRPGDWLAVFGDVQSTPERAADDRALEDLIRSLVEAVGERGHIVVPTFTRGGEFDAERTPAMTGRLAERFRLWPGVRRSLHPTHSVAVLGPQARSIIADHDLYLPFRIETPLGQLIERDGKVLLFGGDQKANALIHVARLSVERPRPVIWVNVELVLEFGGRRRKRHLEQPCGRAYSALGEEMRARGIARPLETDWGPAVWMRATEVFDFIQAIERDSPERLLCSMETCRWCSEMRRLLEGQQGEH